MDTTTTTGLADAQLNSHADREERLARLLRAWWLDERPDWTDRDWWDAPLRDEVRRLIWLPAGPLLAEALATVPRGGSCPDPHLDQAAPGRPAPGHMPGWPCACQVVLAAAWEACGAWCAAGAAVALVDAVGPQPVSFELPLSGHHITDPAREELARALRVTPNSMGNRISSARDLVDQPALVDLVRSSAISAWSARLVILECADLEWEQVRAVVEDLCARIERRRETGRRAWTSAEVGRAARMARRRLCGDADQPARERAFARRRVQVFPDRNGMATLVADLDATDAHRIHRRLSSIANGLTDPAEARTRDQVRADILVDLLLGAPLSAPPSPGHPEPVHPDAAQPSPAHLDPTRPQINVVVSLATLLSLADDPAEIPGLGPIPADTARELAADGTWRAWITDATGAITATGSRGYVPSAGLARLVRAREPHCRMPGCRQPASRCDLDHTVPYPAGPTTAQNLGALCRRHHVLKTHLGWDLKPEEHPESLTAREAHDHPEPPEFPQPSPAWRWRTPAGFTISDHPEHPLE
jgi:hypothetical protein